MWPLATSSLYDDAARLILLGTAGGCAPSLKFDADMRFTRVQYRGYFRDDYDPDGGRGKIAAF